MPGAAASAVDNDAGLLAAGRAVITRIPLCLQGGSDLDLLWNYVPSAALPITSCRTWSVN